MTLDDCYRTLEVSPGASFEEVRRAHRELTKVWHPDRFGHDAALRVRAEEKLKAINEAWETICAAHGGSEWEGHPGPEAAPPREPDPAELARMRMHRARNWAIGSAILALFILLRRPTPAGLVIALVLFGLAWFFVTQMRRS